MCYLSFFNESHFFRECQAANLLNDEILLRYFFKVDEIVIHISRFNSMNGEYL